MNQSSAEVKLSPSPSTFVNSGDSILILRPNGLREGEYQPAKQPATVTVGEWKASDYVRHSLDELPMGRPSDKARKRAMSGQQRFCGIDRCSSPRRNHHAAWQQPLATSNAWVTK